MYDVVVYGIYQELNQEHTLCALFYIGDRVVTYKLINYRVYQSSVLIFG